MRSAQKLTLSTTDEPRQSASACNATAAARPAIHKINFLFRHHHHHRRHHHATLEPTKNTYKHSTLVDSKLMHRSGCNSNSSEMIEKITTETNGLGTHKRQVKFKGAHHEPTEAALLLLHRLFYELLYSSDNNGDEQRDGESCCLLLLICQK